MIPTDIKIHAYMSHRCSTDDRLVTCADSYNQALAMSGVEDFGINLVEVQQRDDNCMGYYHNVGQHVVFNDELKAAANNDADLFLRLDDDVEFITKNWLAKMLTIMTDLGPGHIISPTVRGLNHPPPTSNLFRAKGHRVKLAQVAMGGICRMHWVKDLMDGNYVSDVRKPLGLGDATGIVKWAQQQSPPIACMYLNDVRIKHRHTTGGQQQRDPAYHSTHGLYQVVPYIPAVPT